VAERRLRSSSSTSIRFGLLTLPLYAATGWSRILGTHMRVMACPRRHRHRRRSRQRLGVFHPGLSRLASWFPRSPIILVDQYVFRPNAQIDADWRPGAFVAWGIGSVCASLSKNGCRIFRLAISAAVVAASPTTSSPIDQHQPGAGEAMTIKAGLHQGSAAF